VAAGPGLAQADGLHRRLAGHGQALGRGEAAAVSWLPGSFVPGARDIGHLKLTVSGPPGPAEHTGESDMTETRILSTTTTVLPRRRELSVGCAWAAASCLAIPALANTAFHLLTPVTSGTTAGAVAQAAAHPALAQVAALQFTLPVLAMGVAVLAWRASAVTPRLATTAGVFLAGGYLLGLLDAVTNLLPAVLPQFIGTAAATRAVDGYGHTVAGHFAVLALLGQAPGLILMAAALWRSRVVPRWLAVAFGVTLPFQVLTHSGNGSRIPALSWGWFTVVLLLCGVYLVRAARAEHADTTGWSSAPRQETIAG
jgi:hypothetical protein